MNALILMTKIPIAGKTKTRLMDLLTGNECVGLQTAFLKDVMSTISDLKDIDVFMTYTPEDSFGVLENIVPKTMKSFPQKGDDLGKRMFHAINKVLDEGYQKVVLIGSDIPDLQALDIQAAFELLDNHDVTLGPTYDGGYYLIGMKTDHEKMFHIPKKWGGKSVLESTIDIGNEHDLTIGLSQKYRDIDRKEDLFEFERRYKNTRGSHTMKWIREWRKQNVERQITSSNY